jgi:hypothetical protein
MPMGWFGWGKQQDVREVVEIVEVLSCDEGMIVDGWGVEDVEMSPGVMGVTVCAWCLAEQGIAPDPGDSHGICAFHSAQVLQAYRERKAH